MLEFEVVQLVTIQEVNIRVLTSAIISELKKCSNKIEKSLLPKTKPKVLHFEALGVILYYNAKHSKMPFLLHQFWL